MRNWFGCRFWDTEEVLLMQVSSSQQQKFDASFTGSLASVPAGNEMQLVAALGTLWAHAVNTRIILENNSSQVRILKVRGCLSYCCKFKVCIRFTAVLRELMK